MSFTEIMNRVKEVDTHNAPVSAEILIEDMAELLTQQSKDAISQLGLNQMLLSTIARYKEALKFYANTFNYLGVGNGRSFSWPINADGGKIAREVLSEEVE